MQRGSEFLNTKPLGFLCNHVIDSEGVKDFKTLVDQHPTLNL